jgi:hypothetical protein
LAQFRSTADIMDLALANAGEVTNGNSSYETELLNKLNRVHFSLIAGGTIALGKDTTVEVDETWPWAKSRRPLILELQPKYETGSVTLALASESGVFSSAPSFSVAGWYLSVPGSEGVYRIASHTAAATAFELDAAWPLASVSGGSFTLFKLDYDLTPDYIVVDSTNDKIQFQKVAATPLTGTLTHGTYTPAALATHVASVITAATTAITVTGAYSSVTKKFTLTSDLVGPSIFQLIGNGTQSEFSVHKTLGFDDETTTSAAAQVSTYILGGIARLVEPMKSQRGDGRLIFGSDPEALSRDYPFTQIIEGVPSKFAVIAENPDGSLRVRFNAYPNDKTRVEVTYVPVPRDLKDNSSSIPLVPRKHVDVLEDAATFYIMLLKNDDRAPTYAQLVQGKLMAMVNQHRGQMLRTGDNFGQIIPRADLAFPRRTKRSLFGEEPY